MSEIEELSAELAESLETMEPARKIDTRGPVHFSNLKYMAKSPYAYLRSLVGTEETRSMRMGSLVDALIFEDRKYVVWTGKVRNGKKWEEFKAEHDGEEIYSLSEEREAKSIAASVRRHEGVAELGLLEGERQRRIKWTFVGRACSSRLDVLHPNRVVDLKMARDAADEVRFMHNARRMHYPEQIAFYQEAARSAKLCDPRNGFLIAVESGGAHDVVPYQLTDLILDAGLRACRLWMERVLVCEATERAEEKKLGRELTLEEQYRCWPGRSRAAVKFDLADQDFALTIGGERFGFGEEEEEAA